MRSADPATSHAAAVTTPQQLRASQRDVFALFLVSPDGLCDEDLIAFAKEQGLSQSTSGLRTRRNELVAAGLLHDSGRRTRTSNGRETIIWVKSEHTVQHGLPPSRGGPKPNSKQVLSAKDGRKADREASRRQSRRASSVGQRKGDPALAKRLAATRARRAMKAEQSGE